MHLSPSVPWDHAFIFFRMALPGPFSALHSFWSGEFCGGLERVDVYRGERNDETDAMGQRYHLFQMMVGAYVIVLLSPRFVARI